MRVAVLADIHGNLRAIEAVQSDLRRRSPDVVLNLGDHVSGPLQAAATADLLMAESYVNIRGNHDRQLLDRAPEAMGPSDRAASAQLESRHKIWLAGLPPTQITVFGIFLCHGTPRDDLEYFLEDVNGCEVHLATPAQVRQRLAPVKTGLVLCGHTHIPRIAQVDDVRIINPGSVGLPAYDDTRPSLHYVETGSPHARYAMIDREGDNWRVEFIAVEYDWQAAARDAARANRPEWAHALATGYALRSGLPLA